MIYSVYTDGSARNNGEKNNCGAWGWVNISGNEKMDEKVAVEYDTTNQRMELMAAADALETIVPYLSKIDILTIYTDSAYLHNCYHNKWYQTWEKNGWKTTKKQPVANEDLWRRLLPFFENPQIFFSKVKGHADNSTPHEKWNDYVDKKVQEASAKAKI